MESSSPSTTTTTPPLLTEEETKELKDHPIPSTPQTAAQLALRRRMAVKMSKSMLDMCDDLTPEMRAVYDAYPNYKFFTDKKGVVCRRAYGVFTYRGGSPGLHMCTCMLGWINDVVGGVPCDEVVALDEWTPEQIQLIKTKCSLNPNPQAEACFLDPLGWMHLLESRAPP